MLFEALPQARDALAGAEAKATRREGDARQAALSETRLPEQPSRGAGLGIVQRAARRHVARGPIECLDSRLTGDPSFTFGRARIDRASR